MATTRRRWPIVLGSILGVLVLAVVIGSFVLDGILTSEAHKQAAKLSTQLGRPVKIGSVATKLLSGLAVRVSDVEVGKGEGEKLPLLQIGRIQVRAALLKALTSRGQDIEVRSAEVQDLTVNVVKLEDGKTNLEHLQEKLAEEKKPDAAPADTKPTDLSRLRVDHVAITEGHVRFVDESGAKEKALEIQHLSIVLNDLQAGKPLDVTVKAAVLSAKENFLLQLHAAPLPITLQPTPERVVMKISPIDLAPLAPFVPASVGLEAGNFDADLTAQLGAAVPGGEGKTQVKGTLHALGLKFAGAEGGKALDVSLEADLDGDAAAGDINITTLKLDLGPAGITGSGRASGLKSKSPSVQGLQIVSHDLDLAKLAALYPPLRKSLGGEVAGPIGLTLRGSGTQAQQSVELRLDFTPVRLAIPLQLSKAAGAKMQIVAHAKGAAASNGELRFDLLADLDGVDLRPGESLDKKPGDPLSLSLEGVKSGGQKHGDATKVTISELKAHVQEALFTGNASVELAGVGTGKTTAFAASLHSARVDVDKLLLPTKKPKKEKPPLDPKTFAGLSGHASVKIDSLRVEKQELKNVVAEVALVADALTIKTATLEAFGGTVDASGTALKLAHPNEPFQARVSLQKIQIGQALALVSDKKVLAGGFDGTISLDGKGLDAAAIKQSLAGLIQGKLLDGTFFGKDVIASVAGPLASKLPFGLAGKTGTGGSTSLGKELPFGLQLADGKAQLKQPIKLNTPQGSVSAGGGVTLEGILALEGQADLSADFINALTQGKAKVTEPVPVKFKLGGPAWKPEFTSIDFGDAVKIIVKGAAAGAIGSLLGNSPTGKKAQEILQGGPDAAKAEAEKAARAKEAELQKQAEARAREEADKQKKALEEQAKNKLKGLFGK